MEEVCLFSLAGAGGRVVGFAKEITSISRGPPWPIVVVSTRGNRNATSGVPSETDKTRQTLSSLTEYCTARIVCFFRACPGPKASVLLLNAFPMDE